LSTFIYSLIFTLFIFAYNQQLFANITLANEASDTYFSAVEFSENLKISKADERHGNNIATVFKITRSGYVNNQLINALINELKNNETFIPYHHWLKNIKIVQETHTLTQIKSVCENLIKNKPSELIEKKLYFHNKTLCFNRYLVILSKNKNNLDELIREMTYFKGHIKYYLNKDNLTELNYFLIQNKSNKTRHQIISRVLSEYFVENQIVPTQEILQNIDIDHNFTKFIQIHGFENTSTQKVMFEELKNLIEQAYTVAENEENLHYINERTHAVINYFNLSKTYLPAEPSALRLIGLGKSLARRNYNDPARNVFKSILNHTTEYKEDAYFELLWTYINNENYKEAFSKVIQPYYLHKNFEKLSDSKLKFWIALTLKERSDKSADNILKDIISKDPVSYYAIVASKFLEESSSISSNITYLNLIQANSSPRKYKNVTFDTQIASRFKRLKIWSVIDYKPFLTAENKGIIQSIPNQLHLQHPSYNKKEFSDLVYFLNAKITADAQNHLETFKIIYTGLNKQKLKFDNDVLKLLYPMLYNEQIKKYTLNVDPVIPLSLIRQESAFNKFALSHVGARGLMQLMPTTAQMYQKRLKNNDLYNPNLNLKIGNQYLDKLMKQYDNNLVYVLSAYNAGEGRVNQWRKKYFNHDSILLNIENIPFTETRKYVKLIFRNMFFYKLLSEDQAQIKLADTAQPNKIFDIYLGFNK
jgi:soluble lytic murein transglycosylase